MGVFVVTVIGTPKYVSQGPKKSDFLICSNVFCFTSVIIKGIESLKGKLVIENNNHFF